MAGPGAGSEGRDAWSGRVEPGACVSNLRPLHLASSDVQPMPRGGRCRIRIFVPDGEDELLGDRAVVVCSEVEGNPGAGVTEAAEEIRGR